MSITIKSILDTRRIKQKTGGYPLKLQVSFNRVTKLYQINYDLSQEDYNKLTKPHISAELQEIRDNLMVLVAAAEKFAKGMEEFSFPLFEKFFVNNNRLLGKRKIKESDQPKPVDEFDFSPYEKRFSIFREYHFRPDSISVVFLSYIKRLLQEKRIGSAINYQDTYNSLKKFRGNVSFKDITITYLIQYEQWMRDRSRSKSTVGIKLRPLRSIFNLAAAEGIIDKQKCYPFGYRKYQLPASRNIKKALDKDIIAKVYHYQSDDPDILLAKDYWIFLYFANGMNPKDAALLKYKNIQGEFIVFERAKTELTSRTDTRAISVYISEDVQRIISTRGNPDRAPDNYIFPIIRPGLNPLQQHYVVKTFLKFINRNIAKVFATLGIDKKSTTIVVRHSFSTHLKRMGASTELIQESLGHSNKITTENYLGSFENEVKKDFALKLASFKVEPEPQNYA